MSTEVHPTVEAAGTLWPERVPPEVSTDALTVWQWEYATPAELTKLRLRLRAELNSLPASNDSDDVERLLLAFEELASNGLRHGGRPVQVTVTATPSGWLIDVTDSATDRAPAPAVDRDPSLGGLGLHLVARLAAAHGWAVARERKHVWACLHRTVPA